ncbi:MAG: hypothetical protein UY35_C0005G0057 [Candidatus Saccharibacteria bacterium GW2011_GWC2_48_9]|nr:MAG: hypothetical protein UY35_C0005G0057 [Candidatus Saccharibacteria bacterium GW2011_GWC2_48_9]HCH34221.1 hypothetical protein [Candidatus Saccharibacteria bacterium]
MSESRAKKIVGKLDSPYQRIGVLLVGMVVAIALVFGINMIVQGFGGNEKKIADALLQTLKEDRINGEFTLAQQAQANTFDAKGTFSVDNLKKAELSTQINGKFQDDTLNIPIKIASDFESGTTYVHVSNAESTATTIASSAPAIEKDLTSIAQKINDKWVKLDQGKDSGGNNCVVQLFEKIGQNEDGAKELAKAYAGNRFVKVSDVEVKDSGREEYTVEYKQEEMAGFVQSLKQTDIFKSVDGCDETFDLFNSQATAQQPAQPQAEGSNNDTKIIVEGGKIVEMVNVTSVENQVNTVRVALNFEKGEAVVMPTENIVKYEALQSELASLGKLFQQSQSSGTTQPGIQQTIPQ